MSADKPGAAGMVVSVVPAGAAVSEIPSALTPASAEVNAARYSGLAVDKGGTLAGGASGLRTRRLNTWDQMLRSTVLVAGMSTDGLYALADAAGSGGPASGWAATRGMGGALGGNPTLPGG